MSQMTAAELREFPQKPHWTPEESLALIEMVEGTECIHGIPLPQYVHTRDDKVRWANCVRVGAQSSGDPVSSQLVQQMARTMFLDRQTYT
jgi:hypothetical protein